MSQDFALPEEVRRRYLALFRRFLNEDLSAGLFADTFLQMWRQDRDGGITTGDVIDQVMTGVDCYTPIPDRSSPFDIGEGQLRYEVSEAAQALAEGRV